MKGPEGAFCRNCGMPLSKDPGGGGTERDGGRSLEYCSHCHRAGAFTEPDITARRMMERVRDKLRPVGLPAGAVEGFVATIPTLRRWRG